MAKFFKEGKMASNVLDVMLANAICEENIQDGSLLVLGDLYPDHTYDNAGLEYDTYEAAAPAAADDEVVIVDYAGISEGEIAGNVYKMGVQLYDLEIPAGEIMRVRRLGLHDKFWLGEDNFDGTPVVGKYAIAEAGKYTHKPAAAKPAAGYCVKVLLAKDLTVGMRAEGLMYPKGLSAL